jgi:hypothetical protein
LARSLQAQHSLLRRAPINRAGIKRLRRLKMQLRDLMTRDVEVSHPHATLQAAADEPKR